MPAADTVATLNRLGGKQTPAQLKRFQVSTLGLFSPEKRATRIHATRQSLRRSSSGLQQRKPLPAAPLNGRRNRWSPSDNEDNEAASAPKPKKKTRLNPKKKQEVDKSPLKKHGHNIDLQDNPKVNLNDSPAKNTRSKNHNPLERLKNANLPIPEIMARENKIQVHSRTPSQTTTPTSKSQPSSSRKRKRQEDLESSVEELKEQEQKSADTTANLKHITGLVDEDEQQDESPDEVYFDAEQEQYENGESVSEDEITQKLPKKKRRRPPARKETDQEKQARLMQKSANEQAQREEVERGNAEKFEQNKSRFAATIEEIIQINDCADTWKNLGAAALSIRAKVVGKANTIRCKAIIGLSNKLMSVYKDLREIRRPSAKDEEMISQEWAKFAGRCDLLQPTDHPEQNIETVKEMYHFVIPSLVILLKYVLRGRVHEPAYSEIASQEVVRLLKISIRVCERARSWQPQPITLEVGVRRWVKNGILANLRRLKEKIEPHLERYSRINESREFIRQLNEKQIMAREAQGHKVRAMQELQKNRHRRLQSVNGPKPVVQRHHDEMIKQEIHDVDEIENYADIADEQISGKGQIVAGKARYGNVMPSMRRPGLVREPTADLPPPLPITLSEEEKMALLNGLQRYTGEDRYNEILNDPVLGDPLKKRDLDDLMKTARSFSQMMASKMGSEAYRADKSFAWLRSTDPDMRGEELVLR